MLHGSVADLAVTVGDQAEQSDPGLAATADGDERLTTEVQCGDAVRRALLLDLRVVLTENERSGGTGDVRQHLVLGVRPTLVDGVHPELVQPPIADHGQIPPLPPDGHPNNKVNVVEPPTRRRRNMLQLPPTQIEHSQPTMLQRPHHHTLRRPPRTHPDRRIIRIGIPTGLVIPARRSLSHGSNLRDRRATHH
ncbi:MAG: hypothetical protein QOE93_1729 [Actinomycetota bacterium]|nr:hypothetical protein [Actinomycetota bacterium]